MSCGVSFYLHGGDESLSVGMEMGLEKRRRWSSNLPTALMTEGRVVVAMVFYA